jgi:kanamycin kinase/aminoglycoside 3'-phosphotransferase-2
MKFSMKPGEIPKSLPPHLARAVDGYARRRNRIGCSATAVFHLTAKNKRPLFLKIAPRGAEPALFEEKRRLDWLHNLLPVPEPLLYAADAAFSYLLVSALPGVPASDDSLKTRVPHVIGQLVEGLRMIHAVPIENCPFRTPLTDKIEAARERMLSGSVDEEDFDAQRRGTSAAQVFQAMIAAVPANRDLVFTHGDYCVPNVILNDGRLSGFVDWAEGGVADRFQDLALLSRSVRHNFGDEYGNLVFEMYGIEPDEEKMRFYLLLDEFF